MTKQRQYNYNSKKKISEYEFGRFIKRKRLEYGITLEAMASNICSGSYLSRIENNVIIPSESYFKSLYEKIDLNYEEAKKIRDKNIYHEIFYHYLLGRYQELDTFISKAIKSGQYAKLEMDLFILFNDIIKGIYNEARDILLDLENKKIELNSQELFFYLYCFALYTHLTNQNNRSVQIIMVLLEMDLMDELLKYCLYDLAIDVMYSNGHYALGIIYYHRLLNNNKEGLFTNHLLLHELKILSMGEIYNIEEINKKINEIERVINISSPVVKQKYYYLISRIYFESGFYNQVITILKDIVINEQFCNGGIWTLFILAYRLIYPSQNVFLLYNYKFTKYEKHYQMFEDYISIKDGKAGNVGVFNCLKTLLSLIENSFYDAFFHKLVFKELLQFGFQSSKYKETLKLAIKHFDIYK